MLLCSCHQQHYCYCTALPRISIVLLILQDAARDELFKKRMAKKSGTEPPTAVEKKAEPASAEANSDSAGSESGIWVNRAPVLTLWVSVVAQRQGFSRDAGLTFGKAIAGLLAQSKGRSIGVFGTKKRCCHVLKSLATP